jgi:type I restriction enzyme S subunit
VESLGDIPEHWEVIRLGFLGEFSASGIDKYLKKSESLVKIINFTDVYGNLNKTIDSSFKFMEVTTPEDNRKKHLVKKGDMIFLPSSETYEDLGLSALVNENLDNTSFSYHVIRLVLKKDIAHGFRKYFTNNAFVLNQFARQGKGSTRKIIGRSVFKNIIVTLPPIQEQTAIAEFLDDKTSKIDQAIAIKQQQIDLLKERRQILIHKAVTQGINPNVKLKDSGVEWIGEIPEGWEVIKNGVLFNERKEPGNELLPLLSVSIHSAVSTEELEDNIRGQIKIEDKSNYKLVQKGDVVFNMMRAWQGAIGSVQVNGMVSPAYVVASPKRMFDSNFLEYQYRTAKFIQQMDRMSKGITDFRKRLYWNEFKQLISIFPPVEEQKEISTYIANATTKIATAIAIKEQEIEKLKEYKSSLIDGVVTGKIRVI